MHRVIIIGFVVLKYMDYGASSSPFPFLLKFAFHRNRRRTMALTLSTIQVIINDGVSCLAPFSPVAAIRNANVEYSIYILYLHSPSTN